MKANLLIEGKIVSTGAAMEFTVKSGTAEKQRTACIVVGVFESRRLSSVAEHLDKATRGYLSNIIRRGDLEGSLGQTLLLHSVPGTLADRVLLVGCGRERELGDTQYRSVIAKTVTVLSETGASEAVCYLTELNVKGRDTFWKVRTAVESAHEALYRFDRFKSKKDAHRRPLRRFVLSVHSRRELSIGETAAREGMAIASGIQLAKELGNLPGNICTPSYLAEQAEDLAKRHKHLTAEVLNQPDIEKLEMGAFLSVAKGSRQPPKFIILDYQGDTKSPNKVVLVGKGVTFDAGGISLKPAQHMDEMKYDMCGAAAVLGTVAATAELELPINLIGLIPTCENLPDGNANKPGDIVTSMSGQTIEILNTDAEGRLLLCDALTYAERYEPTAVIDIATLTGACVVALGRHANGLLANHHPLANEILNAGKASGDRAWELPLWEDYQEQLNSPFADMANVGGKEAGTITAACFLARFTKKYHWAHLDIAGTAWRGGDKKGATGRPIPLLVQFLIERSGHGKQPNTAK
jgi:leucyl aminopeptidase